MPFKAAPFEAKLAPKGLPVLRDGRTITISIPATHRQKFVEYAARQGVGPATLAAQCVVYALDAVED